MTTVQEGLGIQAREEVETELLPHQDVEEAGSEDTTDKNQCHTPPPPAENLTGLNALLHEAYHLEFPEEQHQRPSNTQITQRNRSVDSPAGEAESTEERLDAGFDDHEVSDKGLPSEADCAGGVEEQAKNDDDGASQHAVDATALPKAGDSGQPSHPTGDTDEDRISSSGEPRGVSPVGFLNIPPHGGEERPPSESTTIFHGTSDAGQEDVRDRRVRNSSQTGSHGREKMAKQTGKAESVIEDKKPGSRWFKLIFKKIPCFN